MRLAPIRFKRGRRQHDDRLARSPLIAAEAADQSQAIGWPGNMNGRDDDIGVGRASQRFFRGIELDRNQPMQAKELRVHRPVICRWCVHEQHCHHVVTTLRGRSANYTASCRQDSNRKILQSHGALRFANADLLHRA